MLTLQQAVESGKLFTRQTIIDNDGDTTWFDAEDFIESMTKEDLFATDYIIKPDVLTVDVMAGIWNSVRGSNPTATDSKMFPRLVDALKTAGFIK